MSSWISVHIFQILSKWSYGERHCNAGFEEITDFMANERILSAQCSASLQKAMGQTKGWFTDWGHSESTLGPERSRVWWAAFQALEWPQSPAPAPHMSPEDRTQRACSVGLRARFTHRHDFLGGGAKNSESMAKHGEIPCGTRRGGRGAFGSIGLWSYYLRLRPLSDGGQIPSGGHADGPRELASPVSCPFMFAAMELFSWCLSVQDGKMKSRLKDVWDFSY